MKIDLSLSNETLYAGCEIEEVAGRLNLKTPTSEAKDIVGRNAKKILDQHTKEFTAACNSEMKAGTFEQTKNTDAWKHWTDVTLTGPMAVWAYMIVFHAAVHRFARVYYDDGRSGPILLAAHG